MIPKEKDEEKKSALELFRNLSEELEKSYEMLTLMCKARDREIDENETFTRGEVRGFVKSIADMGFGIKILYDAIEVIDGIIDLLDDDSDE